MKEAFAAVLSGMQPLGSDDWRERPVDRLSALGMTARVAPDQDRHGAQVKRSVHAEHQSHLASLGVDLIAFKFGNRQVSGADAEDKVAAFLAWQDWWKHGKVALTARQRDAVARWAVREWAFDACPPRPHGCGGAMQIPHQANTEGAQRMMLCPKCNGTGKRRYSDNERELAMGDAFPIGMETAHTIIAQAEALAMRGGMRLLERW